MSARHAAIDAWQERNPEAGETEGQAYLDGWNEATAHLERAMAERDELLRKVREALPGFGLYDASTVVKRICALLGSE